jgi:hypothetical protein
MTVPFANASLADTLSNRPAPDPNSIGRFFLATDENVFYRDNGTQWEVCGLSTPQSPFAFITSDNFDGGIYVGSTFELEDGDNTWTSFPLAAWFSIPETATSALLLHRSGDVSLRGGSATSGGSTLTPNLIVVVQLAAGNCQIKYTDAITWEVTLLLFSTTP